MLAVQPNPVNSSRRRPLAETGVEDVASQAVLQTGDMFHTHKAGQLVELPVKPGEAG